MYTLGVFSTRYPAVLRVIQQPAVITLNNIRPFTFIMEFLGAFPKLLKAATSFNMSVRPFDRLSLCQSARNLSAPTGRKFIKFHI